MGLSAAPRAIGLAALTALASLVGGGCTLVTDSFAINEFSGDAYPITVDVSSGAVIAGLRFAGADDAPPRTAILDLLSPFTVLDPGAGVAPSVSTEDVLVLDSGGTPRAQLTTAQLLSLHPCDDEGCQVGVPAAPRTFDAIIGANVLAGDAVRLRLGDGQISILADIGGDAEARTRACDGVFPGPFRGGGTLVIGGTELPFAGRRLTLPACLGMRPDPALPQGQRGADALLVASTGVGITILGETAYERYRLAIPGTPLLDSLPADTVYLPSGPIVGRRGVIDRLALVARSDSNPRAACRQVYASHFMLARSCDRAVDVDCPCDGTATFCSTPAIHELTPAAGIDVLVVSDATPTLQALRAELRPEQAEVDGILGANALLTSEVDVDYPHNRILARCRVRDGSEGCMARPGLAESRDRTQNRGCLRDAPAETLF